MESAHRSSLTLAVNLGSKMLCCGAEPGRVEDTIQRILCSLGADRVDVFTITSSIVVTSFRGRETETETRRITSIAYNMTALVALNDLSRKLCQGAVSPEAAYKRLEEIDRLPVYSLPAQFGIYALISGAFSVFFGGSPVDAVVSAAIGVLLCLLQQGLAILRANGIVSVLVLALLGGVLANAVQLAGIPCSPDKIAIGNIMLLVPGIPMTNAIRDMFTGDTISGLLRFTESLVLSVFLALGFALPALLL